MNIIKNQHQGVLLLFKQYFKVALPKLSATPSSLTLKLQKYHKGSIVGDVSGLKKGTIQKKNI